MKAICLLIVIICGHQLAAQLYISNGAALYLSGNAQLSLSNADLVNNGSFTAGSSSVHFLGNANSSISGTQAIQYYDVVMNKSGGSSVSLQRAIGVSNSILFTAGLLNLNGHNIDLGTTGYLNNEQESSRITGSNGGQVLFNTTLNAPSSANPGNLGAIITSSQNLGAVTMRRGHQSQMNSFGNGNSVLRYYDIIPTNNASLNATLRFHYFDAELNGLTENTLLFWRSTNNTTWTNEGFTSRNTTTNYVEKTGIAAFSRWTLSSPFNALPLLFTFLNVKCEDGKVIVSWKTAQEQNTSRFDIERSSDGIDWTVIGSLPAAGNSSFERSYAFTDIQPLQNSFYRIVETDLDGRLHYSKTLQAACQGQDQFKVWPNPFTDVLNVQIDAGTASQVEINIYDGKGALVKHHQFYVMQGNNLQTLYMKSLPQGSYILSAEWQNGRLKKQLQIVKQ